MYQENNEVGVDAKLLFFSLALFLSRQESETIGGAFLMAAATALSSTLKS